MFNKIPAKTKSLSTNFTTIISIFLLILIILVSFGIWILISHKSFDNVQKTSSNFDKVAIIKEIRNLARLQTVEMTIQRDFDLTLDLGNLNVFGVKLLDNQRQQKFAITGNVFAGVDFADFSEQNLVLDSENNLTIDLGVAKILNAEINPEKTYLLKDKSSFLYGLEVLNSERKKDLDQELQRQMLKQGKLAIVQAACSEQILDKAATNAKNIIEKIYSKFNLKSINVKITNVEKCEAENYV
jgi:hypothetical protein